MTVTSVIPESRETGLSSLVRNPYAFAALPLLLFVICRQGVAYVNVAPEYSPVMAFALAAAAAPFARFRMGEFPLFQKRLLSLSAGLIVLYFLAEPFAVPLAALPQDHPAVQLYAHGRWIGCAFAAAAFFRPALLVPAIGVAWILRTLNSQVTGFVFSVLDVEIVFEVLTFAAIGFMLSRAIASRGDETREYEMKTGVIIVAIAVGAHFGNYFYSAAAKLALDGGPASWMFENRLYEGMLGAMERGAYPFAASRAFTQAMFDHLKDANLMLHVAGLLAQLAALISVARRRWIIVMTVAYDAFHIGVYLVYGLLFWKWIALNAILIATLSAIPKQYWSRPVALVCAGFVVFGGLYFTTARLAWYDAPAFSSTFFEAETADGERFRMPPAYFYSSSYQVSHGRFYPPMSEDGHFNRAIWGSVQSYEELLTRRRCAPGERPAGQSRAQGSAASLAAYVWANHHRLMQQEAKAGRANPYLYLHHHMPSPFLVRPFDGVDKRDITAYYYVAESVCLSLEGGELKRQVVKRTEIPLPRPEHG